MELTNLTPNGWGGLHASASCKGLVDDGARLYHKFSFDRARELHWVFDDQCVALFGSMLHIWYPLHEP